MKQHIIVKLAGVTLVLSLILACGGQAQKVSREDKSSLFDDPMKRYPNEMYITGISSGDTPEIAKDRAISEVARVIKADIKSTELLVEEYLETGIEMELDRKSSFTRQVDITTEQTLKNVNIGKTWLDEKDGRYYAIAYLDRLDTSEIYKADLADMEKKIEAYYNKAQTESDKLARLAYINEAVMLAIQRDMMIEQLNTISQGMDKFTPSVKPEQLSQLRREITRDINVRLDLESGNWDDFPGALSEVLQLYGFQLAEENPDVVVRGDLQMEELDRKGYFVRWFVDLHFIDMSTDTEFVTYTDNDREGANSMGEAKRRAVLRMTKIVKQNLYDRLDSYFSSIVVSN